MAKWLPSRDTALLPFAQSFSARVTAGAASLGFTPAEATALANLVTAYQSALSTALSPLTRTKTAVENKDLAKAQLVATIRSFARRIQANPAVTSTQKLEIGLPVHKTTPTPVPPPTTKPLLTIAGRGGNLGLTLRIADETTPDRRAKPRGVAGAEVYTYVPKEGEAPPEDLEQWRYEGTARTGIFTADFNPADDGKMAYVRAVWVSTRGASGPVSGTVSARVAA